LKTDFFEPDFLELVRYAKSRDAKPDDLVEMLTEEEGKNTALIRSVIV